jgi:hypothetical protein
MTVDRYTKGVLSVSAVALIIVALNPWLNSGETIRPVNVQVAEAQGPPECPAVVKIPIPREWSLVAMAMPSGNTPKFAFIAKDGQIHLISQEFNESTLQSGTAKCNHIVINRK